MATRREKEKQRRARRNRLQWLVLLLVLALGLNTALGYWLYETMVVQVQNERLERLTREQAQDRAKALGDYLTSRRATVRDWAGREGTLTALEGEPGERRRQAQRIAEAFEHTLAVRLIPRGQASLERDHPAPIRFAELDLIRRAEQREAHQAELAEVDEQWQLHLISPIPPEGEQPAAGTLLVTLAQAAWQPRAALGDSAQGQTRVVQTVPGARSVSVFQRGLGDTEHSHQVKLPASHLSLSFTPSLTMVENTRQMPALWLLSVGTSAVVSLVLIWLGMRWLPRLAGGRAQPAPLVPEQPNERAESPDDDDEEEERDQASPANPLYQDQDILDIEVNEEDEDILALDQAPEKTSAGAESAPETAAPSIPEGIFRSYDIRGIAEREITPEVARHVGQALGSEALDQGETHMALARDGRTHSAELAEALRQGILATGCHVIDLGMVPTPLMYFATYHLEQTRSGVMVTASHNPAEYNGFKMVINAATLADETVQDVRARIERQQYHRGEGQSESLDIVPDYIERIFSDVALMGSLTVVVDAGNAVTGPVAPRLLEELGCEVIPLYCEIDGSFPNHPPDPTREENLQDLIAKVRETGADLGAALDGDGDRLVVVTPAGRILWPDQLMMLFAKDVLTRQPGADILFDVKCSRQLGQLVTSYGGRPIMWKTGHSHMKRKMVETGAMLGGEYSGHIFFKERWYGFDDGLYTLTRLLEIVTLREQGIDDIFAAFAPLPSTPELRIPVPDGEKFKLVEQLIEQGDFLSGKSTTIDGLRVDFGKGWGLVRPSNTSAALTLRFEAESEEAIAKIQQLFKRELLKVAPRLEIDF